MTTAPQMADVLKLPNAERRRVFERFSLLEWALKHIRLPKGGRLDFRRHPYLRQPYEDYTAEQAYIKGAQLGLSTRAITKAMWVACEFGKSVIYTMPVRDDVTTFTAARINPMIDSSAYLSDRIMKLDSVTVKQFSPLTGARRKFLEQKANDEAARGDLVAAEATRVALRIGTIYFRGTGAGGYGRQSSRAEREATSADSDFNIHDELDRSDPRTREQYEERLSHSTLKWQEDLSTPKIPGQAIDRRWQISDQNVWMVTCRGCRASFELHWPDQPLDPGEEAYGNLSVDPERWAGEPAEFVCHKCGKVIDDQARLEGRWVPRQRGQAVRGYRISQMSYVGLHAIDLLAKFKEYQWRADFWNLVMAMPWADRSDNLSMELMLLAQEPPLGGNVLSPVHDNSLTTMGIDVGKVLNVVIRRPHPQLIGRFQTIWLEEVPEMHWGRLDELMWQFNVLAAVIDAAPETTKAKEFAERHKGRVWRCYFASGRGPGKITWDPDPKEGKTDGQWSVSIPRTMFLDMDRDRFIRRQIGLPAKSEILDTYMEQSARVFRVPKFAEISGADTRLVESYDWVETGPDHFRFASAYEMLASMAWDPRMFTGSVSSRILPGRAKRPD